MQELPLTGTRVLDFMQMWAGPHVSEWLSVAGAEVIKVETSLRLDQQRQRNPPNGSGGFAALNYGKKSVTLNMNQPEAIELAKRLASISDVVADNFGGAVMDKWGLGYEALKAIKPSIIVYTGSGYGRTGPHRELPAYAEIISAYDGSTAVNGYRGGGPNTVGFNAWNDGAQATHGVFAILSALYHRSQTGEGQYIDAAMIEASVNFQAEVLMDYTINGRIPERIGNRDPVWAPYGGFRCKGEDEWVAITVFGERDWRAFCSALGNPEWTKSEDFADELSRWKNQDQMSIEIERWTRQRDHAEVMDLLQKAGLAAGAGWCTPELLDDPQLKAREFFGKAAHPVIGDAELPRIPWHLSDSSPGNYRHSPLLGEHNSYVFGDLLGMTQNEIKELAERKVII